MGERDEHTAASQRREISAEGARQGEIILRKPWQRWVFIGGSAAPS